ncbi:MAG TPA: hypothetical protein PKW10_10530, partial [Saprospiraceae bacterium]|nr:hypothetical protein [Saprospiraceae bacterium]
INFWYTCPDRYASRALLCTGSETIRGSGITNVPSVLLLFHEILPQKKEPRDIDSGTPSFKAF